MVRAKLKINVADDSLRQDGDSAALSDRKICTSDRPAGENVGMFRTYRIVVRGIGCFGFAPRCGERSVC